MELDELKTMWLSNDAKLDKSLKLDEQGISLIQTQKAVSKLAPLYRQRVIESIFNFVVVVALTGFLLKNIYQFSYAVSAVVLLAFYITTLINALKQITLIKRMDFNNDVATIQSSLVMLQTHILTYARLGVLFVPAFLAYPTIFTKVIKDFNIKIFGDFNILARSNGNWWTVQIIAFMVLIPLGIWFYNEVSFKNMHKKWVKNFIRRSAGIRVTKALEFLKELQDLKYNSN
ncbi:hypothetical protein [Pedobacter metabolipauper]|uniref:Uncharacterized protein n=1 Tax=Pedobacter metabolipauper TaxID=425513 RepID=A0A4R6SWW7_9SPHI|nr:hypothetical protein [Pedobacter metabolipauper]TDQ10994.1 hypothetical protein ATK78_0106 [Pedobacter metabolipauper]